MSVMEYAVKFNELNHFAPHQVAIEEMRMNHFQHGLKRGIKSMIAGHSLNNFQEMYERAVT